MRLSAVSPPWISKPQQMLALQQRLQSAGDPRDAVIEQTDEAAPLK